VIFSESCSEERTEESSESNPKRTTKAPATTRPLTTLKKTTFRGGAVVRTTKANEDTYEEYEEFEKFTSKKGTTTKRS
jgi:hypothetical protein